MSNPQQNLKIPGERIQYATEENAGVVQIAKDINSLTNPEHVPTVKTIQEQFGSEFVYGTGVTVIEEEGVDFDYLRTPGLYRIPSGRIGRSMMNRPFNKTSAGVLIVQRTTGESYEPGITFSLHQKFIEYRGGSYERRYIDDPGAKEFSPWVESVDQENINSKMIFEKNFNSIYDGDRISDLNDYKTAGIYVCGVSSIASKGKNFPVPTAGALIVYKTTGGNVTTVYMPFNANESYQRVYDPTRGWSEWVLNLNTNNVNSTMVMKNLNIIEENSDMNNVTTPGLYIIPATAWTSSIKNLPFKGDQLACSVTVERTSGGNNDTKYSLKQTLKFHHDNEMYVRTFYSTNNTWGDWEPLSVEYKKIGYGADLNNYKSPGRWMQPSIANASAGTNYPAKTAGALVVLKTTDSNSCRQMYYPFNSTFIFTRIYNGDQEKWYSWEVIKSTGTIHPRDVMLNTESIGGSNLNAYTEPGVFFQTDIKISSTGLNYPEDGVAGSLIVLKTGAVSRKQIFHLHDKPIFYIREMANSVNSWSQWILFSPQSMELGSSNLNDITMAGNYVQSLSSNASQSRNYPVNVAGSLEVVRTASFNNKVADTHSVLQRFTPYFYAKIPGTFFVRIYNAEQKKWSTWETFVPASGQLGYSQKWNSYHVNNTRKINTDYTNDTNAPIQVNISFVVSKSASRATFLVGGIEVCSVGADGDTGIRLTMTGTVPPGSKYRLNSNAGTESALVLWSELR